MGTENHVNEMIDQVRSEPDPIRRIVQAGETMTRLQQAEVELSRIRREATEQAHAERDLSYSDIARLVGVTRGRISQIRGRGPVIARRFFGIGPIELAIPLRHLDDRELPVVAAEDLKARDQLGELLEGMSFNVTNTELTRTEPWRPAEIDLAAICGPKSQQ